MAASTGAGASSPPPSPGAFAVAVQALIFLERGAEGGVCPSHELADQVRAHAVFLRRLLGPLVRAGIVEAREGREGGYRLGRPAEQITLADVFRAIKAAGTPTLLAPDAPRGAEVAPGLRLAFDEVVAAAEEQALQELERHTLADLERRAEALEERVARR